MFSSPLSPLERYGYSLTELANQGKFAPLAGYGNYVARIFQILLRQTRHKYNPLLLDSDQQRRIQVICEVVRRMAAGDVPAPLSTWQVIALNYEALFASPSTLPEDIHSGQWKNIRVPENTSKLFSWWPGIENKPNSLIVFSRLQALFRALHEAERHTVLFIDHFHQLLGSDEQGYSLDVADLLIPALARREIQIMASCTIPQYREYIERFGAIERHFQIVILELDEEN